MGVGQAGHEEGGEDLLDQLVGGNQDDHFVATPARHVVHVVVDDTDKSQLQDKPGEFNHHPGKKVGPKGKFPRERVTDLHSPEAKKREGLHGSTTRRGVLPQPGPPDEMGQDKESQGPAELQAKSRPPSPGREGATKGGSGKPVLVGEGK